jgi:hypothetical protein
MRNGSVALVIGVGLLLAACGGGTTGPSATTGSQPSAAATSGPTDAGTGSGGEPSAEASVGAPASEAPSAGGGTAAGVCELVTADELAEIFGVTAVKTSVIAGPPDNCIVTSDAGDPLGAWSLTTAQASTLYDAFTADPSSVDVPGIGDKAAIVQNTGLLVLKGGSLLVISIAGGADLSEEEGIEAAKRIGTAAAGRL